MNKLQCSGDYLEEFVFPSLRRALERKVSLMQNLEDPNSRSLVRGLDLLAQELWNLNDVPDETHLFLKPRVKEILQKTPRPIFPKHLLLSEKEAAIKIQAIVRGYLVRTRPDVTEMRAFWREMRRRKMTGPKCKGKKGNK